MSAMSETAEIARLRAALAASEARAEAANRELLQTRATVSCSEAMIKELKLEIANLFYFSRDREMTHPNKHLTNWHGILQSDAYSGYNDLYRYDRGPGPVTSALCWSHARRKFFELADIAGNVRKGKPSRGPWSRLCTPGSSNKGRGCPSTTRSPRRSNT